jgi:hypothetical protein
MARIKCFPIEPIERVAVYLRCYSGAECMQCAEQYHNVMIRIEDDDAAYDVRHERRIVQPAQGISVRPDPRWPQYCLCGFKFREQDRQVFYDQIYRNTETGEEYPLRNVPVGAVWNAWWNTDWVTMTGPDGRSLTVMTPGGEWCIDGRANNCTMPADKTHKCWVRHGSVEDGTLHVDKNGHTCGAGAGSIALPRYHGFLHDGHLVDC